MLVDWRAPGIERYTRDWLMQARGPLPAPDDIAIVAIDEPSIARFGRFPWPRSLAAKAVDAIAAAQPKVIAVDILYTDPTTEAEDDALARSIGRAGNVVVAAQLVDAPAAGGPAIWLMPLRCSRFRGRRCRSRQRFYRSRRRRAPVADPRGGRFGTLAPRPRRGSRAHRRPYAGAGRHRHRRTPYCWARASFRSMPSAPSLVIGGAVQTLRASRMSIDYIGPAGSFAPHTFSLAEVLDGRIPAGSLRGKYVLLGATAASMGDRVASPFVHQTDVRGDQHGALDAGRGSAGQRAEHDPALAVLFDHAGLAGVPIRRPGAPPVILGLLAVAQGRHELLKQVAALAGGAAASC